MAGRATRGQSAVELVVVLLVLILFIFTATGFSVLSRQWLKSAQLSKEF